MKKIDKQIEEYLHYCEYVRRMSPVTIRTKRYVLRRFVATFFAKNYCILCAVMIV